jgi:hypothetical protein
MTNFIAARALNAHRAWLLSERKLHKRMIVDRGPSSPTVSSRVANLKLGMIERELAWTERMLAREMETANA